MKKRLAVFMHGGLPGKVSPLGFPKIVQLVEGLSERFDITVFSLSPKHENFSPAGYTVIAPPSTFNSIKLLRWVYLFVLFSKRHISINYDILFSFWGYPMGTFVVILGKIFMTPSVVSILGAETANLPEIGYGHLRKRFSRKSVLWTCRQASQVIAVSPYQVEILKRYGLERKVNIIPFGADERIFIGTLDREICPPLKLIHVSNLTAVKDQVTLIKAFQLICERMPARLRIIGADFLDGKIQRLVSDLNLQGDVEFIGFIPHSELQRHYQWADAFVLTSLSEGQNNSITEAMMCGLLPVSTAVGSMVGEFGKQAGIVVPCRDHKALATEVVELFSCPEEWKRRRKFAYEWAQAYTLTWTTNQLTILLSGR